MAKLAVKQINTYHVEWLTYSWMREEGKIGMAEYLAQCMGLTDELDLFEGGNDTQYMCDIKLDDLARKEIWVKDRQEQWDNAIKNNGFEHWRLYPILTAAVERGFLAEGHYVIKVSW